MGGILTGKVAVPSQVDFDALMLVAEASRTTTNEDSIKHYMPNTRAYKDLLMAMDVSQRQGKLIFTKVYIAKTIANTQGNVVVAWQRIEQKFAPKIKLHMYYLIRNLLIWV